MTIAVKSNGSVAVSASGGVWAHGEGGVSKKWVPGDYLSSRSYYREGGIKDDGGDAYAAISDEITLIKAIRAAGVTELKGLEIYPRWRSYANADGVFDSSSTGCGLDDIYTEATGYVSGSRGSATYSNPIHLAIYAMDTYYFSRTPTKTIPDYILSNSAYGDSPVGGQYGWWAATGEGGAGTGASAALWRSAVMAKFLRDWELFAAHVLPDGWTVDESPYIQWIKPYLETSALIAQANSGAGIGNDPTWSDAAVFAQLAILDAGLAAAFPNTITCAMTNWWNSQQQAYDYHQTLLSLPVGLSGPDSFGALDYALGDNQGGGLSDCTQGMCAYIGLAPNPSEVYEDPWVSGGDDLRGILPWMATTQLTELRADYGIYFTPAAIAEQNNDILQVTHHAWQWNDGDAPGAYETANIFGDATDLADWVLGNDTVGGVLTAIVDNPVNHTTYPSGLP